MNITYAPNDILQIDDARIIFRNFAGAPSKFNREGDRNFALVIVNEDIANELIAKGWNVKIKAPEEEGEAPFMYMTVKVRFSEYGPTVYLKSGDKMVKLDEESVACLDSIDILSVDLDIRPYDWEVNGKTGRAAYLKAIRVTQNIDRFAEDEQY